MKIVVLGNSPNWYYEDLKRAAGGEHQLEFVAWDQLSAAAGTTESIQCPVEGYDVVLVRGMPAGSLEQVVFRMDLLARWQANGMPVVNGAKSLEAAIDKYLSLTLIREAGLPVPETRVCQNVGLAMEAFEQMGRDVVVKPVFGGEGRGITRITDPEIARRAYQSIVNFQGIIYQQEFIPHGNRDLRLLVIGDRVLAFVPDAAQQELAIRAASAVGAGIAGVDVVHGQDGGRRVLEVNGIPGWKVIARETACDVSRLVIEYLKRRVDHPGD